MNNRETHCLLIHIRLDQKEMNEKYKENNNNNINKFICSGPTTNYTSINSKLSMQSTP